MARYAIIKNGVVEFVSEWDGDLGKWQPPTGTTAIQSNVANLDDLWDGTNFTPPPLPPPDPERAIVAQAVSVLKNQFGTTRTLTQVNNAIDALTVLMRQIYRNLRE